MSDYAGRVFLHDGPCAGTYTITLAEPRYPDRLRAVHGGRAPAVLDLPDDQPEPLETEYAYDKIEGDVLFLDGPRRGRGGATGSYQGYRCAGVSRPAPGVQTALPGLEPTPPPG